MKFSIPALTLLTTFTTATPAKPFPTYTNVTIFSPPKDYTNPGVLYARSVELPSGVLLATWENYSPQPPLVYFPIYASHDHGQTWHLRSKVHDQVNNWGLRYQPFLYRLPEAIGDFDAGTILCAGNSIPKNLSKTSIDLYSSKDEGHTWSYVSTIATGGKALPDNGLTPVWEPFLMTYKNKLIAYYSDQRDPKHGQKLSHQTSSNLMKWSNPVDDVAYKNYTSRPGMTTVTELPNGKYMMTYEYGGGPGFGSTYSFPVYYRMADSPLKFNEAKGIPLKPQNAGDMPQPQSSPYITWSPVGGDNGTIFVSCGTLMPVFYNKHLGARGKWEVMDVGEGVAYTRSLRVLHGGKRLLIAGAGALPPGDDNQVRVSMVDISGM